MTFEMFVMWVLGGLLAAGLAVFVLKRGGHGPLMDVVLGVAGAFAGSAIFRALDFSPAAGLLTMVVVAFVGAGSVIVAQRQILPTVA